MVELLITINYKYRYKYKYNYYFCVFYFILLILILPSQNVKDYDNSNMCGSNVYLEVKFTYGPQI